MEMSGEFNVNQSLLTFMIDFFFSEKRDNNRAGLLA